MDWGFVWLMFIMKIPIAMLLGLVWWAIRARPDEADGGEDGGSDRDPRGPHPRPRRPRPRPTRRGPHPYARTSSPARVRTRPRRPVRARP